MPRDLLADESLALALALALGRVAQVVTLAPFSGGWQWLCFLGGVAVAVFGWCGSGTVFGWCGSGTVFGWLAVALFLGGVALVVTPVRC